MNLGGFPSITFHAKPVIYCPPLVEHFPWYIRWLCSLPFTWGNRVYWTWTNSHYDCYREEFPEHISILWAERISL